MRDVMVLLEYQCQSVGTRITESLMGYIRATTAPTAFTGRFSSRDMESFCDRHGFIERPTDYAGPGMAQFRLPWTSRVIPHRSRPFRPHASSRALPAQLAPIRLRVIDRPTRHLYHSAAMNQSKCKGHTMRIPAAVVSSCLVLMTGNLAICQATPPTSETAWTATADPMPNMVAGGTMPGTISQAVSGSLVFPQYYGYYILDSTKTNERTAARQVKDIRTGRPAGRATEELARDRNLVISGDGKWLAGLGIEVINGKVQARVLIVNARTGKRHKTIALGDAGSWVDWMCFLANGKIALADGRTTLQVFDINSGAQVWIDEGFERQCRESLTVSPGGKYLAYCIRHASGQLSVIVRETAKGTQVGRIGPVPATAAGSSVRPSAATNGLRYSRDGKLLAGLFSADSTPYVVCWDATTGQRVSLTPIPEDLARRIRTGYGMDACNLEWLDQNAGWLIYGRLIVDRKLGKPLHLLPQVPNAAGKLRWRVLDDRHILSLTRSMPGKLFSEPLPSELLAKAAAAIAAGRSPDDPGLPKATAGQIDGAAEWTGVGKTTVAWTYRPTPVAPMTFTIGRQVNVPIRQHKLGILWARGGAGKAIATYKYGFDSDLPAMGGNFLIDFATGSVRALDFAGGARAVAISDDARLGLFCMRTKDGIRLDVHDLEAGKHVAGWTPQRKRRSPTAIRIRNARFVVGGNVLVYDDSHEATLWAPKTGRAIATWRAALGEALLLTADGRYLFDPTRNRLLDLTNGNEAGRLAIPAGVHSTSAAFSPDGSRLATLVESKGVSKLQVWDLATGELANDILISVRRGRLRWCGRELILVADSVIALPSGRIAWLYSGIDGAALPAGSDPQRGDHACVLVTVGSHTQTAVALRATPNRRESVAIASQAKGPAPKPLIQAGMTVSIALTGSVPVEIITSARRSLTTKLEAAGFTVADSQPILLCINADMSETGKTTAYTTFGRARNTVIRDKEAKMTTTWKINGKSVHAGRSTARNAASGRISRPKDQSLQEYLDNRLWNAIKATLGGNNVPMVVWPAGQAKTIGKTVLAARPIDATKPPVVTVRPSATTGNTATATAKALFEKLSKGPKVDREALGQLAGQTTEVSGDVISRLATLTQDPDAKRRRHAALVLGEIGPPAKAAMPALKALKTDPDRWVVMMARAALRKISAVPTGH